MRYTDLIIVTIVACTSVLYSPTPGLASILDSAEEFAVLGSSTVTNTGPSVVTGDLGIYPGSAIVGFPPGIVIGTIHGPDAVSLEAMNDAIAAWTGLKNMSFTSDLTGVDLGNLTLTSGVYHFDTSAQLTGPLTLDAQGNDNAFWVFLIGSTLTTASSSSVSVINPGSNMGLFWQVGSSATLGTDTSFIGNILADQSVTLTTSADILCGRAFALNAAVTMDTNNISAICDDGSNHGFSGGLEFDDHGDVVPTPAIPEPGTMLLFGLGGVAAAFRGRRKALTC